MPTVDLPDFWTSSVVNIITQGLAELTVRPKYGTHELIEFANFVNPGEVTSLGIARGKGMIFGGALVVVGAATCGGDAVGGAYDGGEQYFTPTFLESITYNLTHPHGFTWQLESYDDVLFRYSAAAAAGATFEESWELLYKEVADRTPFVFAKIEIAIL